jgi:hypothetical protein
MLDVRHLDLEEIATALQDQSVYEYCWIRPVERSGYGRQTAGSTGRQPWTSTN